MATLTRRPIQVYLRPQQLEALRALARRRSVSIAELVRQGVDRVLAEIPLADDPLLAIIGIAESPHTDLAEKHDDYLVKFVREENR